MVTDGPKEILLLDLTIVGYSTLPQSLPLAAAVRIARARGRLMQEAVLNRGRMVTLIGPNLDLEDIARTIADLEVDIADDNSSEQVVLSGLAGDTRVAEWGLVPMASRVVALDVSAPFHSRPMSGVESQLAEGLAGEAAGVLAAERAATVTANASGGFHEPDAGEILESLVRQVSRTVRGDGHDRGGAGPSRHVLAGAGGGNGLGSGRAHRALVPGSSDRGRSRSAAIARARPGAPSGRGCRQAPHLPPVTLCLPPC